MLRLARLSIQRPKAAVLVWAPTAGSVSIFSCHGEVTVGLLVHRQQVPDPERILTRVHGEVAAMARLAPIAARQPA